jgi:hypothetical protein
VYVIEYVVVYLVVYVDVCVVCVINVVASVGATTPCESRRSETFLSRMHAPSRDLVGVAA